MYRDTYAYPGSTWVTPRWSKIWMYVVGLLLGVWYYLRDMAYRLDQNDRYFSFY